MIIYVSFLIQFVGFCQSATGSVPITRSLKREVETIALWPQAKGVLSEGEKREKERVGFDWWMVWK